MKDRSKISRLLKIWFMGGSKRVWLLNQIINSFRVRLQGNYKSRQIMSEQRWIESVKQSKMKGNGQLIKSNSIFKKYLNLASSLMSFQVLNKYSQQFPALSHIITNFENSFNAKLWNELSIAILSFLFNPQIKGQVGFDFYTEFVKKFQTKIDPIKLLKIIKQVIVSLSEKQQLQFLKEFESKDAFTEQTKAIVQSLTGLVLVVVDFNQCSDLIHKIQKTLSARKDVDPLVYSAFYEFSMAFYNQKLKYKHFYSSALQYLAYTPVEEMSEPQKISMLVRMAVAALVSKQIYNFSELLEQPSLVSLKNSAESWMYELLEIFNKGDIVRYERFDLSRNEKLVKNKSTLEQKIRIMKFLEIVFNLPKSDRVIKFSTVAKECGIPAEHVETMVMKAMALGLTKGLIDQLNEDVTITWIAPKVLENERIGVMLGKFEEWDQGVQKVYKMVKGNFRL